jgi:hypothetical protein
LRKGGNFQRQSIWHPFSLPLHLLFFDSQSQW